METDYQPAAAVKTVTMTFVLYNRAVGHRNFVQDVGRCETRVFSIVCGVGVRVGGCWCVGACCGVVFVVV